VRERGGKGGVIDRRRHVSEGLTRGGGLAQWLSDGIRPVGGLESGGNKRRRPARSAGALSPEQGRVGVTDKWARATVPRFKPHQTGQSDSNEFEFKL
jgi:hypothetical protein